MYIDQYTDEVKRHFLNPHNMGKITKEDLKPGESLATGTVGNPKCGDLLTIYLKIKDQAILDCKVETFGCASAIACSSVTTDLAMGKTIDEARQISKKDAAEALGGLPPVKMHCSNLAAEALQKAIDNYEKGVETVTVEPQKAKVKKSETSAINRGMTIGEAVSLCPDAGPIMMKYGLHCIGCHVATWETIEQGAHAHGIADPEIDQMITDLNQALAK